MNAFLNQPVTTPVFIVLLVAVFAVGGMVLLFLRRARIRRGGYTRPSPLALGIMLSIAVLAIVGSRLLPQ